jgi:hypothetical protein
MWAKNYYSHEKGFLHSDINTTIPEDAVEITPEYKQYLLSGQASNSQSIVINVAGYPVLQDRIVPDIQLKSHERAWRDSELSRADIELYKIQDSDTNTVGSVGDWRSYRKNLRAWPQHKDFPKQEFRPKAPDTAVLG